MISITVLLITQPSPVMRLRSMGETLRQSSSHRNGGGLLLYNWRRHHQAVLQLKASSCVLFFFFSYICSALRICPSELGCQLRVLLQYFGVFEGAPLGKSNQIYGVWSIEFVAMAMHPFTDPSSLVSFLFLAKTNMVLLLHLPGFTPEDLPLFPQNENAAWWSSF